MIGALRELRAGDVPALRELLARDPARYLLASARIDIAHADHRRLGGRLLGWFERGRLVSALYLGANAIPIELTQQALEGFATHLIRHGRTCSSIVGPRESVLELWVRLEPHWGPARDVRDDQPLMSIQGHPAVSPDPEVRAVRLDEIDQLLPASIAMFTEEVGVSPVDNGGALAYRSRVRELIASGRAFARFESGRGVDEVAFKAEVGAISGSMCQIQGVWVRPSERGAGLSEPGMAAVVCLAQRFAPVVTLYVNRYNSAAVKSYRRVGFVEQSSMATVLF